MFWGPENKMQGVMTWCVALDVLGVILKL